VARSSRPRSGRVRTSGEVPGGAAGAEPADGEEHDTVAGYRKPATEPGPADGPAPGPADGPAPGPADRRGAGRVVVIVAAILFVLAVAGIAFWRLW
jgi:hypothetical protein